MTNKLVNDKDNAKSRKSLDINEDIDLRDIILKDLFNKLENDDVNLKVCDMWNSYNEDRGEWLDRQDTFLQDWDEFVNVEPQGVFESSSNLHIPMPLWVLRTYHARFMQALISPEPSVTVRARKGGYIERAPLMEHLMKYTMVDWANSYEGIEEAVDQFIWAWLATGVGFLKWRWDVQYKQYRGIENKVEEGLPKTVVDPMTGEEYQVPTLTETQVEQVKVERGFNGPVLEFINHEDVAVIGPDITDTRNADAVIHRQYLTADELWTLAERGIVNKEAVEEIIDGGEDSKSTDITGNIKQTRAQNAMESSADKNFHLSRYEILEAYIKYDSEGTGINSDIIVWVSTNKKKLLRATYLNRVNAAGERPIFNSVFHKRSGTNTGQPIGLAEMLHPISVELDAMHNMRIDFGLISTVPFGFYRTGSSITPDNFQIEPGKMFPVDQPGDVYFPTISNRTSFGFNEEEALYKMVERLTGISDLSLGVMSSTQGITRTASGTNTLVGEMNVNLDLPLQRLNRGWKKSLKYLMHLLQQRMPKGKEFRITGDDGVTEYLKLNGPEDISGDYDVEVAPSSAASNKTIQQQQASQILQVVQNPLLLQIGIVTPENVYEAVKNFLKAIGIKSVGRFINAGFENAVTLSPKEEVERALAGQIVSVLPNSDHEGVIAYADSILGDDERLGEFSREQAILLKGHKDKHQQMLNAMKQMKAQQANMNQVAINQQLGPSGTPDAQAGVSVNNQGGLPE